METLKEKAQELFRQGLFDSCLVIVSLFNQTGLLVKDVKASGTSCAMHADCLVKSKQYHRSLVSLLNKKFYERALKLTTSRPDYHDQIQIRYVDACLSSKEYYKAREKLEVIPVSKRTLKTLKQLATVNDHFGEIKSAIECYKSIVKYLNLTRMEPFALEAILALLNYGVSYKEIRMMLPSDNYISKIANATYLSHSNAFPQALTEMKALEEEYRSDPTLLSMMAQMYRKAGDDHSAKQLFVKLRRLEPDWVQGIDVFAAILRDEGNYLSLHRLASDMMEFAEHRPETFVTCAIMHEMKGDFELALECIDKAIKLNNRYHCAHQIRGKVLVDMNRFGEASLSYRTAYGITRDIVTYEGLVFCYISMGKMLEATSTAKEALALLPSSPRATCLAGVVMSHNPSLQNKAKEYFEKALKMDPKSLQTLFALAELHVMQSNIQKAIELLESNVFNHHIDTIHEKLGKLYIQISDYSKATQNFQAALNINPENQNAKQGLLDIERSIQSLEEDVEVQSDVEIEMDEVQSLRSEDE